MAVMGTARTGATSETVQQRPGRLFFCSGDYAFEYNIANHTFKSWHDVDDGKVLFYAL